MTIGANGSVSLSEYFLLLCIGGSRGGDKGSGPLPPHTEIYGFLAILVRNPEND